MKILKKEIVNCVKRTLLFAMPLGLLTSCVTYNSEFCEISEGYLPLKIASELKYEEDIAIKSINCQYMVSCKGWNVNQCYGE